MSANSVKQTLVLWEYSGRIWRSGTTQPPNLPVLTGITAMEPIHIQTQNVSPSSTIFFYDNTLHQISGSNTIITYNLFTNCETIGMNQVGSEVDRKCH